MSEWVVEVCAKMSVVEACQKHKGLSIGGSFSLTGRFLLFATYQKSDLVGVILLAMCRAMRGHSLLVVGDRKKGVERVKMSESMTW